VKSKPFPRTNWVTAREPLTGSDDDTVVVVAQMEATACASGQSFRAPICHVVRIRDGLLMEFRIFFWDTVATNRAPARDQHFVKVMPRDFVGERPNGTGGRPG
jgi:ketosteroid isomerase-like protein